MCIVLYYTTTPHKLCMHMVPPGYSQNSSNSPQRQPQLSRPCPHHHKPHQAPPPQLHRPTTLTPQSWPRPLSMDPTDHTKTTPIFLHMQLICQLTQYVPPLFVSLSLSLFLLSLAVYVPYVNLTDSLPTPRQTKTVAPVPTFPTVVNRLQFTSPHIRKDNKNRGSSRFNISQRRDIQKLPPLKGMIIYTCT